MANRYTLHIDKLEEFRQYLNRRGISHRDGRGTYQVLQVRLGGCWHAVFKKSRAKEHLTIPAPLTDLLYQFINQKKQYNNLVELDIAELEWLVLATYMQAYDEYSEYMQKEGNK